MIGMRDELVNNLDKLSSVNDQISGVEEHLTREHQKPSEIDDPEIQQDVEDQINDLERELID